MTPWIFLESDAAERGTAKGGLPAHFGSSLSNQTLLITQAVSALMKSAPYSHRYFTRRLTQTPNTYDCDKPRQNRKKDAVLIIGLIRSHNQRSGDKS
jgi:hypothetical protein